MTIFIQNCGVPLKDVYAALSHTIKSNSDQGLSWSKKKRHRKSVKKCCPYKSCTLSQVL